MHGNANKNRTFTSYDVVSVVALCLVAVGIAGSILKESLSDDGPERAVFEAEVLAHQMAASSLAFIENDTNVANSKSNRGPASVQPSIQKPSIQNESVSTLTLHEGELGTDPWGQPFHYRLLRSNDNRALRILVWSNGPDHKLETRSSDFDIALSAPTNKVHFRGDDVGYLYQRR